MTIEIDIADPYQPLISATRLRRAIAAALAHENAVGDVTLVVADDDAIADLNQRFLGVDGPTDVLSFPADGDDPFVLPPDAEPYLGDIMIAFPYAARQAENQGNAIAAELDLLAVHGTLHLLGYDHAEPEEKAEMWARQDAILASLQAS